MGGVTSTAPPLGGTIIAHFTIISDTVITTKKSGDDLKIDFNIWV